MSTLASAVISRAERAAASVRARQILVPLAAVL